MRIGVSTGGALLLPAAGWLLFGLAGAAGGTTVALLWLAWRHDNETGTCLPLAVLVLIVLAVMLLLFFMLVVVRPR